LSECEFREYGGTDFHTLFRGEYELLPIISTFIVRFGWNLAE